MTHRLIIQAAAVGIAAAVAPEALGQTAPARPPGAAPVRGDAAAEEEIIVSGQRARGSIPSEAKPETTLGAGEVRSLGASSVGEALAAIAPQTGSARGRGGQPVILLNGRRISSFDEIRNIPSEAIARIDIFTEEQALEFGFPADSRVVNIVLRQRYRAVTAEGNVGLTGAESAKTLDAQVGFLRLSQKGRIDINGKFEAKDRVTEFDRGVRANLTGPDDRRVRSLSPDSETYNVTGVWNHVFGKVFAATGSVSFSAADTEGYLGRDGTGALIRSDGLVETKRFGATVDAQSKNWVVTTTLNLSQSLSRSAIERSIASQSISTRSLDTQLDAVVNASGALFAVPAGDLRLNLRGSAG
ncbi:MAG: hypothetical protein K2Q06_04930, partial [Parvularculaceae bacterium]|nr:hypothetical protein [Parvularculaceae bacterium]